MSLLLHEFHAGLNANFIEVNSAEVVANYGDVQAEYTAIQSAAGVIDLSFRSRLCLVGADRQKFLNGQVTNNVKDLEVGAGCYAALVSAKGKMQSDLFVYNLGEELLLDFEPGFTRTVTERLDKYIIADDVQIVDVSGDYGLVTVQGPNAKDVIGCLKLEWTIPSKPLCVITLQDKMLGQLYMVNQPRAGTLGFDLFIPAQALAAILDKLMAAARESGGRACGWEAFEIHRVEAGIPRFGIDMDERNLAPEAGIANRAISYTKGCYIGQEVIARVRTYGQVAKSLQGLRFVNRLERLPGTGAKLFHSGKEVGYVTSSAHSPLMNSSIGLGYVRREVNQPGNQLVMCTGEGEFPLEVVGLPFAR